MKGKRTYMEALQADKAEVIFNAVCETAESRWKNKSYADATAGMKIAYRVPKPPKPPEPPKTPTSSIDNSHRPMPKNYTYNSTGKPGAFYGGRKKTRRIQNLFSYSDLHSGWEL